MQTKRDNLVLIAAFVAAVVLHAVMLPWVGAAVGEGEQQKQFDVVVHSIEGPTFLHSGDQFSYNSNVIESLDGKPLDPPDRSRRDRVLFSRDRFADESDVILDEWFVQGYGINEVMLPVLKLKALPTIPIDADGPYWLIYQADFDQQLTDADRSNNTRVAPIYIDGPQRPELAIESFNAPDRAAAGGSLLIDFAIQNLGDGWASSNPQLGEHGWADRVYLSVDDRLDGTDHPLRTIERTAPLGPAGEYRHNAVELAIPRGVTGPMHLILVADADQVLDQPGFTAGFKAHPIELIDTNEPDLIVAAIRKPDRLVIGRPAPVTFSIANTGSVPTTSSDWVDGLYLSRTSELDDSAIELTQVNASQPLQPRSRYETTAEVTLPEDNPSIAPGRWYLVVKADADDAVNEAAFEDNNTLAIPIDVLTQEQADAEIKLGDPDRPERLVVQWIEHDRIEEHIAQLSRTVQPALQSQADPDPNAPLVDNPKPPAIASAENATGDPTSPNNPLDPDSNNSPRPIPTPPDATATDVAPRPQTEGVPTPERIEGLPGNDGTLNPIREGTDQPSPPTPPQPLDPTPSDNDTPSPTPGERDLPSPADPNAPETNRTTDSDTPADTETDTDSDNPDETDTPKPTEQLTTPDTDKPTEETETDKPSETDGDGNTEQKTTDTSTTPKPNEDDSDRPDGEEGDPATPSEEQTPTRAPKDDSEAPPTNIKIVKLELQEGKVLVGKGIKVTTKLPTVPGTGSRVLSIPRNARVAVTFDSKGKVYEAKILRSTTYKEWDAAIEASLYRWSAQGEAIENAKPHVTIEWDYLLNDLFDEDE